MLPAPSDRAGDRETELYPRLRKLLLAELDADAHCCGTLSSSAVATAVASFALAQVDRSLHRDLIERGLEWLVSDQNEDGGWGDSPESPTNLTATVLAWAALGLAEADRPACRAAADRARGWLERAAGGSGPESIRRAVLARYGNDRTFACPILTLCTLAGRMGGEREAWPRVPQLPFELSILPHGLFRFLRLTVVSYALPALIAIGMVRHRRRPSRNALLRWLRDRASARALRIAERMQPSNGGFEEATPLTGFVTMSLAASGLRDCEIVKRGVQFLTASVRGDGSWPIDTNLATWLTSLAVVALAEDPDGDGIPEGRKSAIRRWLLDQQYRAEHPLTFGAPGGWAWTDLPGGMPDADDTAGTLLALRRLGAADAEAVAAAERGIGWLLDLQNGDGGIPTFSRGWGRLPFDRSCPDITAHALQAAVGWRRDLGPAMGRRVDRALPGMLRYLSGSHREGAWVPLWFGNQYTAGDENPCYGTCRVVLALEEVVRVRRGSAEGLLEAGRDWLRRNQNDDGGWGGARGAPSSVEETALAVAALAGDAHSPPSASAVRRGCRWLDETTAGGERLPANPMGLYFAKLWYSERLYPLVFAVWALARVKRARTGTDVR